MIELSKYFECVLSADEAPIVICDLNHTVIYMNPTAVKRYKNLVGSSIFNCHNEKSNEMIVKVIEWFKQASSNNKVHTLFVEKQQKDIYMIALRDTDGKLIGYYEKHESRIKDNSPFYM